MAHRKSDSAGKPTRGRVLIVDDEPEMLSLLAEELEDEGFEIRTAKNGLDVVSEIPFTPFDILITDWKLPLRDGLVVLKTVNELRPDVPVVFITAFGDTKIRKKVEKTGAVYLQKPFSMDDLKRLVHSLLRGTRKGSKA